MDIVIILGIIAVFFAWLENTTQFKYGLIFSFVWIFLFTALRYNFGTDYPGYYKDFIDVGRYANIAAINFDMFSSEKGWLILTYLFQPIGFFGMIFFLSAFICYIYYSLIKKYVHKNYYWLAVLIYVFSSDIMLIQFSAIRQAVSIAIFLYSIKYLLDDSSPLKYILLNIIAGTIHSSAYFMIIFVVFSFNKVKVSNYIGYTILLIFFALLFWGQYFIDYYPLVANFFAGARYASRFEAEMSSTFTLMGGIYWYLLLVMVIYFSRTQSLNYKILYYLYSIFFMTYIMSNLIFLADRLGYYFAPFCMIVLPHIAINIKKYFLRYGIISLFLVLIFYRLFNFFTYDWVIYGYDKYQTIFSAW